MDTVGAPMNTYWMKKMGNVKLLWLNLIFSTAWSCLRFGTRLCDTLTTMLQWGHHGIILKLKGHLQQVVIPESCTAEQYKRKAHFSSMCKVEHLAILIKSINSGFLESWFSYDHFLYCSVTQPRIWYLLFTYTMKLNLYILIQRWHINIK